jgi:hypothetical protein
VLAERFDQVAADTIPASVPDGLTVSPAVDQASSPQFCEVLGNCRLRLTSHFSQGVHR